ncbi:NAD(P)-binding domain-containing protein [Pseudomonas syringae]|nr:NAD(P)-binding domain-containing protein [Pseudomonas syringae]
MISSQLARLAIAAGYNVILSNSRSPDTLSELVAELGEAARAATPDDAAHGADIVVASIPFASYKKLSATALAGKIVVNTMNYYPERDGDMPEVQSDRISTSELVQRHLVNSHVVRAANNVDWVRLHGRARSANAGDRSALPVAGDDEPSKGAVKQFLDSIGYDTIDMGVLSESWRSEPTMPVYVMPYIGDIPADLTPEIARDWFLKAPGVAVPAQQVADLVKQARRHDKMFGSLASLAGSSL